MSGIVTITFSPCIDKSTSVPELIPEKKLKCSLPKLEPGGGGINVARAIRKLGGKATAIYPVGGYTGQHFLKLMKEEAVPSITIETENETRENIIVLEEANNRQYRFGMPGTELQEREWMQILIRLEEIVDMEFIVASGSLPAGVPTDIFARIAKIAMIKGAKFIVDTSGNALASAAAEGVYLIKPNLGELAHLTGKSHLEADEAYSAATQVIEKGESKIIVVSMGREGAILVTKEKSVRFSLPPVKIKSTVGAGDSMVAGIVLQLSKRQNIEDSVRYGVACGTAATMNAGTGLCKLNDVENLYEVIVSEHRRM